MVMQQPQPQMDPSMMQQQQLPRMNPMDMFGLMPGTNLSPLDHWALRAYNRTADQLMNPSEMDDLIDHVMEVADSDEEYWRPRNMRMLEDQKFWEIGRRYGNRSDTKSFNTPDEEEEFAASEEVELTDGYLTVDKIVAMGSGATWSIEVPPKDTTLTDTAQKIENFVRYMDDELNARHGLALNSTINRDEWHWAALRGWITGMVVPDPTNQRVPIDYVLEDPIFVYPRFSRKKLLRVIHRYSISVLEAQDEFPEAMEFLFDSKEDEEIDITIYWDDKYKVTILGDSRQRSSRGREVVQPLTMHGYIDMDGEPINPWIIVTPRGTPTRRASSHKGVGFYDREEVVRNIGLGVLHPIKGIIERIEKLVGQLHTEVAKGVNPPHIVYYDGANKPEILDLGIGSENYLIMGQQEYKPIETTAMKPDVQPLIEMYNDRLQRGSIPTVLYGNSPGGISGYAINLLSQGSRDILSPLLEGIKLYRELKFRRILEMYSNVSSQFAGPLNFRYQNPVQDMTYTNDTITAQDIISNGAYVCVKYDDVLPKDRQALVGVAAQGVNAGILPLYDALKDWVGIKDPRAALVRIAEDVNYKDPEVLNQLKIIAAERSGNALLQEAVTRVQQQRALMAQQQMMAAQNGQQPQPQQGSNPTSPQGPQGVPSSQVAPNLQANAGTVPSAQAPMNAVLQQQRQVGATQNVANGANPPAPMDLERLMQALGL